MKNLLIACMIFAWPVSAFAADPGCATTNLLDDLAKTAPAEYEAIRAQADAVPNGEGIFWQVTHPNLAHTSWLFGTLHKADPRVVDLPDSVTAAFDASDTLAVELTNPGGMLTGTVSLISNPGKFYALDGVHLSDRIAPEAVAPLRDFLAQRNIDLNDIERLRPWLSIGFLVLSTCDLDYAGAPVLDEVLIARAKAADKQLIGLETVREQLDLVSGIDEDLYVAGLEESALLHEAGLMEDMLRTTIQLYLDEDLAVLSPLSAYYSEKVTGDTDAAKYQTDFERQLLDARNGSMALKSAFQMAKGPTFVAVGAAHLYGETGLVADLRERGFTVTRIPLER